MNRTRGVGSNRDLSESFQDFLGAVARLLFWAGVGMTVVSVGFLIYTATVFGGGNVTASAAQAESNISIFQKVLIAGVLSGAVGSTYLFWGESVLGAVQLILAGLMYFAPLILTSAAGLQAESQVTQKALATVQVGGGIFGLIAVLVLLFDIVQRAKLRMQQGARAEQLKYGKGIKEEKDRQNVFMGKCWQLPFCRKFVRDRCPIYHARRTCWKERVGCMCEEEVIRNAMENKAIPKDVVAAANYIPRNNKLTEGQKAERCKQCVIYNEHQKHKYRAALPGMLMLFMGFYVLFRGVLMSTTGAMITSLDSLVGRATFQQPGGSRTVIQGTIFHEILLVCLLVIAFAYAMKALEYLIFKAKV
jgi:hypothetical protein